MLNYQRVNPPFFHFLGLSCKFSLKPIHWMLKHPVIQQWKNAQHNGRGRAPWMTCAILWGSSRSTLPSWAAMGNSHSYDMRNDIAAPKWIERIEKLRDVENWTMWGGEIIRTILETLPSFLWLTCGASGGYKEMIHPKAWHPRSPGLPKANNSKPCLEDYLEFPLMFQTFSCGCPFYFQAGESSFRLLGKGTCTRPYGLTSIGCG